MPMLKIDVHPAVYSELEDSRSWYEECAKNLGNEFLCEVDRAFSAVQQAPLMWPGYDEQQGDKNSPTHRLFLFIHGVGCIIKFVSLNFKLC